MSYDYTPYGQTRGPPAQATGVTDPAFQPYAHAGQYQDATGLINLRNRLYDPATGRFTTTDPLGGSGDTIAGTSLYAYGNLNPLAYTDPLGLFGWPSLQNISDGAAAFGDTVTFGGTAALRRVFEADGVVDRSSWAYTSGSIVGGVVTMFIPGGAAVNAGRIGKATNTAWSAATATTKARIGLGAAYGATNAGLNTWAATGDCFTALRDTAIGGVLGGTFAGVGEVVANSISKALFAANIVPSSQAFTQTFRKLSASLYSKKSRPSYRKGVVEEVWENAKDANGVVRDPNTGEVLTWDKSRKRDGQWDMGHRRDHKYSDLAEDYREGLISRKEYLDRYNDPNTYYPEKPANNRGHKYE